MRLYEHPRGAAILAKQFPQVTPTARIWELSNGYVAVAQGFGVLFIRPDLSEVPWNFLSDEASEELQRLKEEYLHGNVR